MANATKHFRISSEKFNYRDATDSAPATVQGHAALFNVLSEPLWELGGAREMLMPGCFTDAIARPDDVRLLINHDASLILARNVAGTLTLSEDALGLFFTATLPDTSYARDLQESMRRGDLSQCSFAFTIDDASMQMQDGEPVHVVSKVSLSDTSIVTFPAYVATDASLRSHYEQIIKGLTEKTTDINTTDADVNFRAEDDARRVEYEYRKRQLELMAL